MALWWHIVAMMVVPVILFLRVLAIHILLVIAFF